MINGGGIDNDDDFTDSSDNEVRTNAAGMVPMQAPTAATPVTANVSSAPQLPVALPPAVATVNNNTMNIVDDSYFDTY